jgi:hypothetical protein
MTRIVTTNEGQRFRLADDHGTPLWLWECKCGEWAPLSEDQWNGRVSVDHASMGCPLGYHETHNFGRDLVAHLVASRLCEQDPFTEDNQ